MSEARCSSCGAFVEAVTLHGGAQRVSVRQGPGVKGVDYNGAIQLFRPLHVCEPARDREAEYRALIGAKPAAGRPPDVGDLVAGIALGPVPPGWAAIAAVGGVSLLYRTADGTESATEISFVLGDGRQVWIFPETPVDVAAEIKRLAEWMAGHTNATSPGPTSVPYADAIDVATGGDLDKAGERWGVLRGGVDGDWEADAEYRKRIQTHVRGLPPLMRDPLIVEVPTVLSRVTEQIGQDDHLPGPPQLSLGLEPSPKPKAKRKSRGRK